MVESTIESVWAFIRGHTTADMRFEEHLRPIRYVIEPGGRLVAPAMVAMLTAVDTVLFVPEYTDDVVELMISLEAFDEEGEHGGLADRWRIYHGDPEDVRWTFIDIDAAKWRGEVIDGEALARPNPLAGVEAALCRDVNRGSREALQALCRLRADADVEEPVMVGIDPLGLDVRRRFDVIRVPVETPMETEADARRTLAALLPGEPGQ